MSRLAPLPFVLVATTALAYTTPARAGDCSDLGQVAKIGEKVLRGVCNVAKDKFDCAKVLDQVDKAKEVTEKWNTELKSSSLTIGPRSLPLNETVSGKLVVGGKRTWISVLAPSGRAVIEVNKRGGKGADITICTIRPNGVRAKRGDLTFADKSPDGSKQSFTVDAPDELVLVKLDAHKTQAFAYDVLVKAR